MLKFYNPNYVTAVETKAQQHRAAVDAWLKLPAQAAQQVITLAELRAGLPAIAADLTRLVFNEIASSLRLEVLDASDQQS